MSVHIIASKTQVSPVKAQTIPRLELLGATILSRLIHTASRYLSTKPDVYCWTESLTILCWIKKQPPLEAVYPEFSTGDPQIDKQGKTEILSRSREPGRLAIQIMFRLGSSKQSSVVRWARIPTEECR